MAYKLAEVKFNNGNGTVLCNVCSIMLTDSCNVSEQIDCYHLCEDCYNEMNGGAYEKLRNFAMFVANDYFELSHEKVLWQRNDFIKRARHLLDEIYCDGQGWDE